MSLWPSNRKVVKSRAGQARTAGVMNFPKRPRDTNQIRTRERDGSQADVPKPCSPRDPTRAGPGLAVKRRAAEAFTEDPTRSSLNSATFRKARMADGKVVAIRRRIAEIERA
jgi:hypothetical protein